VREQSTISIGKSRAGITTTIHLAVRSYGLPIESEITAGDVDDCSAALDLITRLPDAEAMVADKGYDSDCIREQITKKRAMPVIPGKAQFIER